MGEMCMLMWIGMDVNKVSGMFDGNDYAGDHGWLCDGCMIMLA